ncbi:golgi uridine diphosphate-N-acetylglucosamine transporter [Lecanora helva]
MSTLSPPGERRRREVNTNIPQNGSVQKPTNVSRTRRAEKDDVLDAGQSSQGAGSATAAIQAMAPYWVTWAVIVSLIFGGCCSNVFALETIIKEEPDSGLLITFVQFIITALFTWPNHFSISHPPFFLKPRAIPLVRWLPNIIMFFSVNMLNNFAFGYNISVPVHIILRSGGSIMTMAVGYVWGKRYTKVQVFSVAMLTMGIIMAAMGDAQAKGKTDSKSSTNLDDDLLTGLAILFIAQLLSAIMGLYTQLTYDKYGSHWHENLFYSHALSIPLFSIFFPSLLSQFRKLLSSPPIHLFPALSPIMKPISADILPPILPLPTLAIPKHILTLTLNALTQYICIRGVNLLGARTTALGVSIVLNVRKLISLFLSIWLFGNKLPPGVVAGAAVVFGSAGVWAWEGQRIGGRKEGEGKEGRKRE